MGNRTPRTAPTRRDRTDPVIGVCEGRSEVTSENRIPAGHPANASFTPPECCGASGNVARRCRSSVCGVWRSADATQVDHLDPDPPVVDLVQDAIASDTHPEQIGATPRKCCRRSWVVRQFVHHIEHRGQPLRVIAHVSPGRSERRVGPDDLEGQARELRGGAGGSPKALTGARPATRR